MSVSYPPEVWGGIAEWLDSYSLAALVMTGDQRLRYLLRQGVESLDLDLSHLKVTYSFVWPSFMLQSLPRLRRLRIVLNHACAVPVKMHLSADQVSMLPRTLHKLSLGFDDGLCGKELVSLLPPRLLHLSLYHNKTISSDCLLSLPANLIGLTLSSNQCLTGASFAHLPKQLQSLDLSSVSDVSNEHISLLPKDLTELHLPLAQSLNDASAPLFPESLLSLNLSGNAITNKWFSDFSAKSLTSLSLRSAELINDNGIKLLAEKCEDLKTLLLPKSKLTIATLLYLPNTLTQIDCVELIEKLEDKFIIALPRHLTTIDCRPNTKLTFGCFQSLPRGLRHIDWPIKMPSFSVNNSTLTYLPPALKTLDLSKAKTISNETIKALPPALTALTMSHNNTISDQGLKYLPQKLETLHLFANKEISPKGLSALPQSLRSLTINGPGFNESAIQYLPRDLTSLTIETRSPISDSSVPLLPRSLKLLRIATAFLTEDCIEFLPPQLRNLYVSQGELPIEAVKRVFPKLVAIKI